MGRKHDTVHVAIGVTRIADYSSGYTHLELCS